MTKGMSTAAGVDDGVKTAVGYFPAGDPALHIRSMAFPRAMDLRWAGQSEGRASVILPFSAAVLDVGGRAVDPLAILGALDHACSTGVYTSLKQPLLIATVDLRVEFAMPPAAGRDVLCQAWTVWSDDQWALTRAEARCATSGSALAFASSAYALGAHPGSAGAEVSVVRPPAQVLGAAPSVGGFAALLGMQHGRDGSSTMPFRAELIGAQSLPALHGGSTAAALASTALETARRFARNPTAKRKLLSVSVQFLRAAETKATHLNAELQKRGARLDVLTATAHQGDVLRPVARADCLVALDM